ncbi:MAG: hypothetical protein Q7T16_06490 [Candidatus Burarchaeum sp.]|nr:hypothetical protein [Candidatus Burarchaeum sp.]MDO8340277.1 hypothetical protein [Candidatus Burarchaeum sp.]
MVKQVKGASAEKTTRAGKSEKIPRAQEPKPAVEGAGKRICIICQQEKDGYAVRNDIFIAAIRGIKQTLGIATNNVLVVCNDCASEHRKRRSGFEKTLLQYGVFGAIIGILLLAISLSLSGLLMAAFMVLFMLALAVIHYHPASEAQDKGVNAK